MKVGCKRLAEVGNCCPSLPAFYIPLSACARGRQAVHASVCNLQSNQNAQSSQPAMRALACWPIACIQPASQPRACIMHEDSGCTQIRSWMAGWMDGWLDACARARARMHPASQSRARIHYACQSLDALRSDHARRRRLLGMTQVGHQLLGREGPRQGAAS